MLETVRLMHLLHNLHSCSNRIMLSNIHTGTEDLQLYNQLRFFNGLGEQQSALWFVVV